MVGQSNGKWGKAAVGEVTNVVKEHLTPHFSPSFSTLVHPDLQIECAQDGPFVVCRGGPVLCSESRASLPWFE